MDFKLQNLFLDIKLLLKEYAISWLGNEMRSLPYTYFTDSVAVAMVLYRRHNREYRRHNREYRRHNREFRRHNGGIEVLPIIAGFVTAPMPVTHPMPALIN